MGYWYWRPLKSSWVLDEGTTNRFSLPERGHLSGLYFRLKARNLTANYAKDNLYPLQNVTTRIVANGNVELVDLRGRQLKAMNYWDTGEMPKDNLIDTGASDMEEYGFIPFGRYLGDPEYGLILERFAAGVEFEDTNTFDTTYWTDTYQMYDIWGLFRKDPEAALFAKGFLKKRQILNKDTASETQYGVKLPTQNKLKQIHMFSEPDLSSNVPETGVFTNLDYIWLGVKSREEYILNNARARILARIMHHKYKRRPRTTVISDVNASEDNFLDTMIYERESSQLTCLPTTDVARIAYEYRWTFWERVCKLYQKDDTGTRQGGYVYADSVGICLNGDIPLLDIDPMAPEEDYLDAKEMADVYVEFTEGASTGNIYVVLDELQKTYPT